MMDNPLPASLTYVSEFAGIGGFEVGFGRAGMRPTALIEWDKHKQTVLREHYPTTPLMGDITDVRGTDLGRPDVHCGGFPCQDTSIAAPHRAGLAGKRSGHFHEFTRLVAEYQRLVDESNPRWLLIENPAGLLRSNDGADMDTVYRTMGELGYGVAHRVVDGRHLGSPFRRPRVIVVGHRGGDPRPAWLVLGDDTPGGEAVRTDQVGGRPRGPRAAGDPAHDAVVWRKSARPRKSLALGGYETWVADGDGNVLTGFDGGLATRQTHLIAQHNRLRTLSLTEWERGMGFPDGWTAMLKDSARYAAIGDAIHTGTAEWLARRLVAVDALLPQIGMAA